MELGFSYIFICMCVCAQLFDMDMARLTNIQASEAAQISVDSSFIQLVLNSNFLSMFSFLRHFVFDCMVLVSVLEWIVNCPSLC